MIFDISITLTGLDFNKSYVYALNDYAIMRALVIHNYKQRICLSLGGKTKK